MNTYLLVYYNAECRVTRGHILVNLLWSVTPFCNILYLIVGICDMANPWLNTKILSREGRDD